MSAAWRGALLVLFASGAASAQVRIDGCALDEDRCLRAAIELRDAWDRCDAPRFVVDETAYSSNVHRLQGVWCEWTGQNGNGVFHSSPVAWAWVAATASRPRHSRRELEEQVASRRAPLVSSLAWRGAVYSADGRISSRAAFFGDAGPVAQLVQKRLMFNSSRLSGAALVLVEGTSVMVVERHPLGDVRPGDLPWGMVPWRPAWFFVPQLSREERQLLATVAIQHVIRTTNDDECLVNALTGARMLAEGPAEQDATLKADSCARLSTEFDELGWSVLARQLWEYPRPRNARPGPTIRDALREALTAPADEPAFTRPSFPNVDAFPVHRAP